MAVDIRWTKRAVGHLDNILNYLSSEWGEKSASKFALKISTLLKNLKNNPELGKLEIEDKNVRAFVVSRHNSIFYRIKNKQIIILAIFDNRMNPKKKKV